ncbi:GntR family transcriptional regulator [Ammoniphilus resinae]|uniref:DNA-binding GntR family transcriptional regulator n=1 Tax=Ammoniphilus resinae TaxID=861532 RepID=A0ABS4GKV3_9BACL|nr:GntR family transcriptional regulator [Ammoniphilus resinae]MBP1930859.1 DNA-binding GntR family transcriptional regulator [Ammoniphilus resinae]
MAIQDEIRLEAIRDFPSYTPLREVVYQTLKKAILNGELKPGQMLSENMIANQLSMSRTPVREAIRSLENENLVSIVSGRKVIVSVPSLREIADIYDIRLIVETEALRRITPEHVDIIQKLENCVHQAQTHIEMNNLLELQKMNSEFHLTIIMALQNQKMMQFLDSLQDTIVRFRHYSLTNRNWAEKSEKEHKQIVDYLKQGNPEAAVLVLQKHLKTAKDVLGSVIF